MFSTINYDSLAYLVKANPEFESVVNTIIADNKKANSMLVHELRNPLTLLKGTIQYIESKHPETRDYKYWDQIQDIINDMEKLMAEASLYNTYNLIQKEDTNLITVFENLINSFMPQALTKDILLSLTIDSNSRPYFMSYPCDVLKIKQVLINLIKNAFEATTPGNFINVELKYVMGDFQSPSKLSIEISNNGAKIPEDELENIFLPFVTHKKGGTGMGLALAKKVVDMHFGSISVESSDLLTTFKIMLPI